MHKNLIGNIPKIYTITFFRMFLIIMPIIIPFYRSLNLSMREIFELQAIFSISTVFFEIPSGYLSDILGRKATLLIGNLLVGLGFSLLCWSTNYYQLIFYQILLGTGFSLNSGTDLSILYDSIDSRDNHNKFTRNIIANRQLAMTSSEAIAAILSGIIISAYSFKEIILTNAIIGWIPFLITFSLIEPPIARMDKSKHLSNLKMILRILFKDNKLLKFTIIYYSIWSIATFLVVWIFQKYWLDQNIKLIHFGYIWAAYNITVGIVGKRVNPLIKRWGIKIPIMLVSILPILGYFGMSFSSGIIGILFGFLFQISRGINQVLLKDIINWKLESQYRATANSIVSLIFRVLFILLGPIIGFLIDQTGASNSFFYIGFFFLILFIIFTPLLLREISKEDFVLHE